MARYTGPRGDDLPICEQCGERHVSHYGGPSCVRHVNYDREQYAPGPGATRPLLDKPRPCKRSPSHGQTICAMHGARAPHMKAQAESKLTKERAEAALRRFGEPIDTTPTDALLDAVKWTAGYVAWLREKVAVAEGSDDAALTEFSKATGKREANAWVDLLGQWHDRLVRICKEAIGAGIEERRVRIAEQQGALVADVIRKILDDLDLTPEQAGKAGDAVPRHLRALAS